MSEDINIFKNLEDLRKTNFLEHLKSLEPTEAGDLNDSHGIGNDDFDFDSIVNSTTAKKTPTKMQQIKKQNAIPKKKNKNSKSRRSSTSSGPISPTMPLVENFSTKEDEMPIGRRTRRSVGLYKQTKTTDTILENIEPSTCNGKGSCKGKGGGRGRGRGRSWRRGIGKNNLSASCLANSIELSESSQCIPSISSSTEVSAHELSLDHDSSTLAIMERFLQPGRRGRLRVMRGRRQCIAEIAARSTQVDYIDLVSSPMPRVEGFIDLDSDTEESMRTTCDKNNQKEFPKNSNKNNTSTTNSTVTALNISFDEDNPELNIKINWRGKLEAFKLRKHQKFSFIFEQLAERENISIESIVFNLNDRIIMTDDTPDTINYKIFHFIDGRILTNRFNSPRAVPAAVKKRDANQLTLKVQSDKWKRPLQIKIMKTDKFRILYIKCAEELKVGVNQLKLSFDGEILELNDTPADLDLEGGEAIDLRITN